MYCLLEYVIFPLERRVMNSHHSLAGPISQVISKRCTNLPAIIITPFVSTVYLKSVLKIQFPLVFSCGLSIGVVANGIRIGFARQPNAIRASDCTNL